MPADSALELIREVYEAAEEAETLTSKLRSDPQIAARYNYDGVVFTSKSGGEFLFLPDGFKLLSMLQKKTGEFLPGVTDEDKAGDLRRVFEFYLRKARETVELWE